LNFKQFGPLIGGKMEPKLKKKKPEKADFFSQIEQIPHKNEI
jgi:hypothetical protein